jgi:putative ABC transport system permease protein
MLIQLAFRNLLRNPRRTATALLTVGLGTASIFVFQGYNTGIMDKYRENTIHSRYGNGQINTAGYRDQVYEKPWQHWINDPEALQTKIESIPGVIHAFPRVEFFALLTDGKVTISGRGQGVDSVREADFFTAMNVEQGKMLTDEPNGVMLGLGLAHSLNAHPGDRITVLANTINGSMNGLDLIVTGIFHTGVRIFDETSFRIPLKQAQTLLDTNQIESLSVGLKNLDDWDKVASLVRNEYPALESVPFAILDLVYYQHSVDWLEAQFSVIRAIILTIVLLGIFNTISTGILERKQEIGNLRANGESVAEVMQLLAWEGAATGIIGSAIGLLLAFFLIFVVLRHGIMMPPAPGLTRTFLVQIVVRPKMALTAFALGSITVVIATILAGIRVAKMALGDALRSL